MLISRKFIVEYFFFKPFDEVFITKQVIDHKTQRAGYCCCCKLESLCRGTSFSTSDGLL